jgi:hypothetical protein
MMRHFSLMTQSVLWVLVGLVVLGIQPLWGEEENFLLVKKIPQVLMAGFDPMLLHYNDGSFRGLAVVEEGNAPLRRVTFTLQGNELSNKMNPIGTIPLTDQNGERQIQGIVYEIIYSFRLGSLPIGIVKTLSQFNIFVIDQHQEIHSYPDINFGNHPKLITKDIGTAATLNNYTSQGPRREEPQVIMTGVLPMLLDYDDNQFDLLVIARHGIIPIDDMELVVVDNTLSFIMHKVADLMNGDELYKATYAFPRGSLPLGDFPSKELFGSDLGELGITITDKGGNKYSFPFLSELRMGDYPELPKNKRAAILVHPRGSGTGYKQAVSIEFMAQHVYRALQARGYEHNDIYFLSYNPDIDINGDGKRDFNIVDGPMTTSQVSASTSIRDLTFADIQQAFTWAKQQGELNQPLLVIFVDHADKGFLRLDPFNEILTAPDFKALLDDYQQTTGNQVITILEACHTGTFIKDLAAPNRLVITSTAENKAYYDALGSLSFLTLFFDELRHGENFQTAFQRVTAKLPTYGYPFNQQVPQLEDDGNGHANTSHDGHFASQFCLNGCYGDLSANITLEPQTTAITDKILPLQAKVGITGGKLKRVWASITTPEVATQRNAQGFALTPSPVVNLTQGTDKGPWEGQFNGFNYQGEYVVTFMAEDQEGFITTSAPLILHYTDGPAVPTTTIATPISAQAVYRNGDTMRVTLPPLPASQTQYVGMGLPGDSSILVLSELNQMKPFNGTLPTWQGGEVMMELPIVPYALRGEYSLYLLRVPAGVEPLAHPEQWMLGVTLVKVE